ncbi:hypothetical protein HALLA_14375 [Halostagnicola larsenii XH-48]|uniref:Uncharacterized protein n=1 Tax=Halostagnicola larsenii XH-48 TaxID=797299 RepID=W0JRB4_9EURY|nr:hypothetical protein HALLA_14375 [Halostagnicola larsenii XH-48]
MTGKVIHTTIQHRVTNVNRRTVLQSAGVFATVGLAGCVGGIQEHFVGSVKTPVPVEIYNEADRTKNVQLEAQETGSGRGSYDQSYSVTPNERVGAPSMDGVEQSVKVVLVDRDGDNDRVEVGTVTSETTLVSITLYEDDLDLEISTREDAEANESNESATANETAASDSNETTDSESNESA